MMIINDYFQYDIIFAEAGGANMTPTIISWLTSKMLMMYNDIMLLHQQLPHQ